MTINNFVIKY